MDTHVVGSRRELDVIAALRRLRPAFDPEPAAREAAKHRLMMVLTALPPADGARMVG
jgi:hypothetical protein